MKYILTFLLFFPITINSLFSQKLNVGFVVDKYNKCPLDKVQVSTINAGAITNSEGKFLINYGNEKINFSYLGYQNVELENFNNGDTIYLVPFDNIILDSINISGKLYNYTYKQLVKNIINNYPFFAYAEDFFLRGQVKKNDTIYKIVDLFGVVDRNTLFTSLTIPKLKYKINIKNGRKAGKISANIFEEDIAFNTLKDIFSQVSSIFFFQEDRYNYYKSRLPTDSIFEKINFTSKKITSNAYEGYYIFNNRDYSIHTVYVKLHDSAFLKRKFKKMYPFIKWRKIGYDLLVNFKYNKSINKYTILNAQVSHRVELVNRHLKSKNIYSVHYDLLFSNPRLKKIKKNVSEKIDVFKLKFNYNQDFWKNQSQLPLTKEMKSFINSLQIEKVNNEFRTIINK